MVEWRLSKTGKWVPKAISEKYLSERTRTRGQFAANAGIVRTTLKHVQYLLATRRQIVELMRRHKLAVGSLERSHQARIGAAVAAFEELLEQVAARGGQIYAD